jgi:hypothetical protein
VLVMAGSDLADRTRTVRGQPADRSDSCPSDRVRQIGTVKRRLTVGNNTLP